MNSYEHTSREFLPLSVIRSACAGDTDAVEQVLRHYRGYINKLCTYRDGMRIVQTGCLPQKAIRETLKCFIANMPF